MSLKILAPVNYYIEHSTSPPISRTPSLSHPSFFVKLYSFLQPRLGDSFFHVLEKEFLRLHVVGHHQGKKDQGGDLGLKGKLRCIPFCCAKK